MKPEKPPLEVAPTILWLVLLVYSLQFRSSGVTERLGALGRINTLGPNLTQDRIPELLFDLSKSSMILKQQFPC